MKKKQGNENILLPDRVMKLFAPHAFALMAFMALLTCGLVRPASADIYWFTDETGVVHFSNVPTDKRYVPFTEANDALIRWPRLNIAPSSKRSPGFTPWKVRWYMP
jgi:hypothetical protein